MKPIYKITANGTDLDLGERLISLSCSDESGFKSDSCSITLDDRNSSIELPNTGAVLSVYLGYESTGLSHIGNYIVNNVSLSGAPDRISIKAHGLDFKSSFKEKVSENHASTTLGALVSAIASKHGLAPKVAKDLSGVVIDHIAQTNESDMHFLTRLAKMYGAVAKPTGGNLVFAIRDS